MAEQEHRSNKTKVFLALLVFAVVISLLAGGLYVSSASTKADVLLQSAVTPSPEVESGEALRTLRSTEDAALMGYSWVDRENGIVRIPIDRAIDLVLERGLPTRPQD